MEWTLKLWRLWQRVPLPLQLLLTLALALCALSSGCATSADIVSALGRDTNSLAIDVVSPWGTVHATRNLAPGVPAAQSRP